MPSGYGKRFDKDTLAEINESIVRKALEPDEQPQDKTSDDARVHHACMQVAFDAEVWYQKTTA